MVELGEEHGVKVEVLQRGNADLLLGWIGRQDDVVRGFLANGEIIRSAVDRGECLVALNADEIVGFITWFRERWLTTVLIACVGATARRAGVGRGLVDALVKGLPRPCFVVGECSPPTSEPFWRRMNFDDCPKSFENAASETVKLIRLLGPDDPTSLKRHRQARLLVWEAETWQSKPDVPAVDTTFSVRRVVGPEGVRWTPVAPLALSVCPDWQARLQPPVGPAVDHKVKYLPLEKREGGRDHVVFVPTTTTAV